MTKDRWDTLLDRDVAFALIKTEGLDVTLDEAATVLEPITRVASGAYDMGLADINTLIKYRDQHPSPPVRAVFMVYNKPPFAIVARRSRGITEPKQLENKKLGAPPTGITFGEWPLFAKLNNIDMSKVAVETIGIPLRAPMLAALDVAYMRALEAGEPTVAIAKQKQALRDATRDPAIDAAQSSLTAIEILALCADALPNELPPPPEGGFGGGERRERSFGDRPERSERPAGDRGDRGDRLRDDHRPQHPERAGAIDHRRLVELALGRLDTLARLAQALLVRSDAPLRRARHGGRGRPAPDRTRGQ